MDRLLVTDFIAELDDDNIDGFFNMVLGNAQKRVEVDNKNYYNYYPYENNIQLIVDTTKVKDNNIELNDLYFHHTTPDVWNLKIVTKLKEPNNTYFATNTDGSGGVIIRLVNSAVLGEIKEGKKIKAQVAAFAINGRIYKDEKEYEKEHKGQKFQIGTNTILPTHFLVNNNANLSKEEKEKKDHSLDCLLSIKAKVLTANKLELNMFDAQLRPYFCFEVQTDYGKLRIFFTVDMLRRNMKNIGEGNIFEGEIFISGDPCIFKYEKFIKDNNLRLKSKE